LNFEGTTTRHLILLCSRQGMRARIFIAHLQNVLCSEARVVAIIASASRVNCAHCAACSCTRPSSSRRTTRRPSRARARAGVAINLLPRAWQNRVSIKTALAQGDSAATEKVRRAPATKAGEPRSSLLGRLKAFSSEVHFHQKYTPHDEEDQIVTGNLHVRFPEVHIGKQPWFSV
jgi:hypothetical protein